LGACVGKKSFIAICAGIVLVIGAALLLSRPGREGAEAASTAAARAAAESARAAAMAQAATASAGSQTGERSPASIADAPLVRPDEEALRAQGKFHRSVLRVFETLVTTESAPFRDGSHIRTQIVRARFKYPLVRIEERIAPSGEALAKREMVADHVIVQLQDGATVADLQSVLDRQGSFSAQIRKAVESRGLFLVAFDGVDPGRMEQVIKTLESERQVIAHSEPDYIVRAN
jgi:hypothetical protein